MCFFVVVVVSSFVLLMFLDVYRLSEAANTSSGGASESYSNI